MHDHPTAPLNVCDTKVPNILSFGRQAGSYLSYDKLIQIANDHNVLNVFQKKWSKPNSTLEDIPQGIV